MPEARQLAVGRAFRGIPCATVDLAISRAREQLEPVGRRVRESGTPSGRPAGTRSGGSAAEPDHGERLAHAVRARRSEADVLPSFS